MKPQQLLKESSSTALLYYSFTIRFTPKPIDDLFFKNLCIPPQRHNQKILKSKTIKKYLSQSQIHKVLKH